ncbi:hypothetical protein [Nocardia cerradoensis]|uniref:hypothetical protein n=1 Tax=Nocardia cerradoensis TaxID=85688 RepID=UPI0012F62493|nr:hypothetical protein [Nocardia cerradoensis]NKY46409.1 hypothetical protein [Nocardia cerradoensis]
MPAMLALLPVRAARAAAVLPVPAVPALSAVLPVSVVPAVLARRAVPALLALPAVLALLRCCRSRRPAVLPACGAFGPNGAFTPRWGGCCRCPCTPGVGGKPPVRGTAATDIPVGRKGAWRR